MPIIVAWIGTMLLSVVGQMVLSALVSLGIGLAVNHAAGPTLSLLSSISGPMSTSGLMMDYAGWLGIDKFITIIMSAWMGRKIVDSAKVAFMKLPARPK